MSTEPTNPPPPSRWARLRRSLFGEGPSFTVALLPLGLLALALFTRNPQRTNFIYDEQEALLANPYVRSVLDDPPSMTWRSAFYLDFWGRKPEATIGSYRPLPNLIWRGAWWLTAQLRALGGGQSQSPFLCHWINVLLHGVCGALLAACVWRLTRQRAVAWMSGALFTAAAILTEAVSGVVGLADVLCGLALLACMASLAMPLPWMACGVFLATTFGLYSKETSLVALPLVALAAWLSAEALHPRAPRRLARGLTAGAAASAAFVLFVELRRTMFPSKIAPRYSEEALAEHGFLMQLAGKALRWFAQPGNPHDPINNPLLSTTPLLRVAGGLRVYARGLAQSLWPWRLSGDYSAPQEPAPTQFWTLDTALGLALMVAPLLLCAHFAWRSVRGANRVPATADGAPAARTERAGFALLALACAWLVLAYFPVSNLPVVLPTVRAERFWYVPMMAVAVLTAWSFHAVWQRAAAHGEAIRRGLRAATVWGFSGLLLFQCVQARRHANDYVDDLAFWDATRKAAPRSAKAHLNYSVMVGARGRYPERIAASEVALQLAPNWPMANVYLGDALCRMQRAQEALPHYLRGFELGPNELGLLALGLQCLWDQKLLAAEAPAWVALQQGAEQHPGSWYAYLVHDLRQNGEEHHGVAPKYRPRGYNEGPRR